MTSQLRDEIVRQIDADARSIAGAIYEDADGSIADKLDAAIRWQNMRDDRDLADDDRVFLWRLLDELLRTAPDAI